mmetsp:Transcript_115645/g.334080  ORF Transcript_115645/g.334080 Transcript_115645/m.334080 type:complete len:308 (-) Transcript_115645:922-1845(-)
MRRLWLLCSALQHHVVEHLLAHVGLMPLQRLLLLRLGGQRKSFDVCGCFVSGLTPRLARRNRKAFWRSRLRVCTTTLCFSRRFVHLLKHRSPLYRLHVRDLAHFGFPLREGGGDIGRQPCEAKLLFDREVLRHCFRQLRRKVVLQARLVHFWLRSWLLNALPIHPALRLASASSASGGALLWACGGGVRKRRTCATSLFVDPQDLRHFLRKMLRKVMLRSLLIRVLTIRPLLGWLLGYSRQVKLAGVRRKHLSSQLLGCCGGVRQRSSATTIVVDPQDLRHLLRQLRPQVAPQALAQKRRRLRIARR